MPFGQFQGQAVASLDRSYLAWLRENCELQGPLVGEISRVLNPPIPDEEIEEYRALHRITPSPTPKTTKSQQSRILGIFVRKNLRATLY
jgi:hypothetical protein